MAADSKSLPEPVSLSSEDAAPSLHDKIAAVLAMYAEREVCGSCGDHRGHSAMCPVGLLDDCAHEIRHLERVLALQRGEK